MEEREDVERFVLAGGLVSVVGGERRRGGGDVRSGTLYVYREGDWFGGGRRRDGCCGGGLSRAGYVITARIQILFTYLNCSSTALLYNPPVPIAD